MRIRPTSLNQAVEAWLWAEWSTPIPKTLVLSLSDGYIPVRLPAWATVLDVTFTWENGAVENSHIQAVRARSRKGQPSGQSF